MAHLLAFCLLSSTVLNKLKCTPMQQWTSFLGPAEDESLWWLDSVARERRHGTGHRKTKERSIKEESSSTSPGPIRWAFKWCRESRQAVIHRLTYIISSLWFLLPFPGNSFGHWGKAHNQKMKTNLLLLFLVRQTDKLVVRRGKSA